MKRKRIIALLAALAILLLFPVRHRLKDGGTVVYRAILYSVQDVHRLAPGLPAEQQYVEGTIVHILGMEVFNSVPSGSA